jgi:hypothetical protein
MRGVLRFMVGMLLMAGANVPAIGQSIPVEVFVGHERTRLDMLWFRPFAKESHWLFFNRNVASVDHSNRTSFGSIAAVSYNLKMGLGAVVNATFNNGGAFPKAGLQYARRKGHFTLFGWVVVETLKDPDLDLFLLTRFEPPINEKLRVFSQLELFTVLNADGHVQSTQRIRLGLGWRAWQFGPAADLTTAGTDSPFTTTNLGGFLRHEF